MPLNRPAQALPPGPRGVADARRWAIQALTDLKRPELIESACISVSEVTTNALLHADQPVTLRLRGTVEHPRIEVRDASLQPPALPSLDAPTDDELLLTFGRGLSIVARVCTAWGVDIDESGKVVWFVPRVEVAEGPGVQGTITQSGPRPRELPELAGEAVDVLLGDLPVADLRASDIHLRELRRELRLLSLGHDDHYPLAGRLSSFFDELDDLFWSGVDPDRLPSDPGSDDVVDLVVTVPRKSGPDFDRFLELLDLADAFCHQERLLTLARTPDQVAFQTWMLGEFVRQTSDGDPVPWTRSGPAEARRQSVS